MTPDSITSAAHTEAAHRDLDPGPTGKSNRAWFVAGAEWQAAQETDAERAVRWLHREREWRPLDGTFIGGTVCNTCRRPYPCPTISVLDEPARRDEEKRDG